MGIDAKMMVLVDFEPTEQQLKLWSWDLCRSIAPQSQFLIAARVL